MSDSQNSNNPEYRVQLDSGESDVSSTSTPKSTRSNSTQKSLLDRSFQWGLNVRPKTRAEQTVLQIIASIAEKPNWMTKIDREELINKWLEELSTQKSGLTSEHMNCALGELKSRLAIGQPLNIRPAPVNLLWESDNLISDDLKQKWLKVDSQLVKDSESCPDWHPGSNNQVLDLVHPSLYPLICNQTRQHVSSGGLEVVKWTQPNQSREIHSEQVLTDLVRVNDDETKEINNPGNDEYVEGPYDYYARVQTDVELLTQLIELMKDDSYRLKDLQFQKIYEDLKTRLNCEDNKFLSINESIEIMYELWEDLEARANQTDDIKLVKYVDAGCDEDTDPSAYDQFYKENRRESEIQLGSTLTNFENRKNDRIDLKNKTLQVITKIAHICLTPDQPEYDGGVWHIEGMENENIVATGIYYYESDNLTESKLAFRQAIKDPEYGQGDDEGVEKIYGLNDEDPLNQNLGAVITQANHRLAFPNIFQHQVQPFRLLDPTRPAVRKILVFFLVHPDHPIVDTSTVPPQQPNWSGCPQWHPDQEMMTLAEANVHRTELMKERKFAIEETTKEYYERPFSLCEH
jgi:hypothetical protein